MGNFIFCSGAALGVLGWFEPQKECCMIGRYTWNMGPSLNECEVQRTRFVWLGLQKVLSSLGHRIG